MKVCPKCNAQLNDDSVFCTGCGQNLPEETETVVNACPNSATSLEDDAVFCANCGTHLKAETTTNEVDLSTGKDSVSQSKPKKQPIKTRVIIAAVIVFALFNIVGCGGGVIHVKADEMIDEISRSLDYEKKYKDATVHVTGRLIRKAQFKDSTDYYMVIASRKIRSTTYKIVIEAGENAKALNSINIDDFVSVRGRYVGIVSQSDPNIVSIHIHANKINE